MGVYLYPSNTETPLKDAYIGIPFPTSIVLDKSSISLTTIGQTEQLTATIQPTVSDKTITWATSDPTVATVSTTGLVTCVTPGTCTITATTVNGLTASCSVDDNQGWQPGVNTIAYYPLDGDADDASGNGYDGTASNVTYTTLASGIDVGTFNGSSSKITIADSLINSKSAFTISVWSNATGLNFGVVLDNQSSVYDGAFVDNINGTLLRSGLGGGGVSQTTTTLNSWHHLVLTYNSGSVVIYVDKIQVYTETFTYVNGTDMTIGAWTAQNRYWQGYISKVIFEDKAWDATEVSDYYNQTKSLYGIS